MKILFNNKFLNYNQTSIYEGAYRIKKFAQTHKNTNVDYDPTKDILKIHSLKYFEKIKRACNNKNELVGLHLTPEAFDIAKLAVAFAIKASETNDFSVARPPGHHASFNKASGFCLFNNIAIAVNKLVEQGKKVAVLDLDGHHGDGTEKLLQKKDNVLICSIHQKEVFPGTGYTTKDNYINFSLKSPIEEKTYMGTLDKAIIRIKAFNPDIVGISLGFDTFKEDTLLDFNLEIDTYREIGYMLKYNFKNMFAILEGGYHKKIVECSNAFVSGVNSALD